MMLKSNASLSAIILGFFISMSPAAIACERPGQWWAPGGKQLEDASLYKNLATSDAVMLGELHDRLEHHRWQLSSLAQLRAHEPNMVIGIEMLPRSSQQALDAWVSGQLDEEEFLRESKWYEHWGFNPELYLPILHFARLHGIPIHALDIERDLVRRIGRDGWDAVPIDERYGITAHASPDQKYLDGLKLMFDRHAAHGMNMEEETFIRSQLARDRALAQGIHQARNDQDEPPLVVALIGRGHLDYGYGVPRQLKDLGLTKIPVLLPVSVSTDCAALDRDLARAVFSVDQKGQHELQSLYLGISFEKKTEDENGIRVTGVQTDSVASRAGLEVGDRIMQVAGMPVNEPVDIQLRVHRQSPGTWLPLLIERNGDEREIIARFPAKP